MCEMDKCNKITKIKLNVLNSTDKCLFIYKDKVNRVSRKLWERIEGKHYFAKGFSIKYFHLTKDEANRRFYACFPEERDNKFSAQSGMLDGVSVAISMLKALGELKDTKLLDGMNKMPTILKKIMADWDIILCEILTLIEAISSAEVDIRSIIRICLNLYTVCRRGRNLCEPQGMDTLLLGTLLETLPSPFKSILRNMSLLSNGKILDDATMFSTLVNYVVDFLRNLINKFSIFDGIREQVLNYLDFIPFGKKHAIISEIKELLRHRQKDPGCLNDPNCRDRIRKVNVEIDECEELAEMASKSALIKKILSEFACLRSYLDAYEKSDRLEPSCFIFEGKPGTMKSIIMNQVLQALGDSNYLHTIKATSDGKDFWDSYDNQHNVVFDDMGQQGISQYRLLINLVSCVKYPLDCAAVEKKDTKFFNSKRIFVTTNNFMNLNGLVRSDGISDVRALWRRGYVFHFNVQRKEGKIEGEILFKYFDSEKDKFVIGFPSYVKTQLKSKFEINKETLRRDYIKWICNVIKMFDSYKEEQHESIDLSIDELEYIQFEDVSEAQGSTISVPKSDHKEVVPYEVIDDFEDIPSEYLDWMNYGYRLGIRGNWEQRMLDWIHTVGFMTKGFIINLSRGIMMGVRELGSFIVECYRDPSLISDNMDVILGVVANVVWIGLMIFLNRLSAKLADNMEVQGFSTYAKGSSVSEENCGTMISSISKSVYRVKVYFSNKGECHVRAVVSGHCLILPSHAAEQEGYLTLYKDYDKDHRLLDHVEYRRVYLNKKEDVCIVMINPAIMTPFKSVSKYFKNVDSIEQWLVNEEVRIPVGSIAKHRYATDPIVYDVNIKGTASYECVISKEQMTTYSLEGKGLCGSVIATADNGIVGMHVAGQPGIMGVAINWKSQTISEIKSILDEDKNNFLNFKISEKVIPNFSGIKLDTGFNTSVGSKSSLIPSPLYKVYGVERVPADLTSTGKFTVKDMAKKSFDVVQNINEEELDFAKKAIDIIIPGFGDATDKEVIKGCDNIAGINKKSSNGYECEKLKTDYIDFENGECLPGFKRELEEFECNLKLGKVDPKLMLNVENLKDELRNKEKALKPRCFRVSTVHSQFLTKKYTMKMVSAIMHNREFNQIMVGVNPYKEWNTMYKKLKSCAGIWAGDLSAWDGKMLPQVQNAIIKLILSKYKGKHKSELSTLLYSIPYNLDNMMDDTYLTTHSMPSGNFLTAIFNSVINRAYTAMWYYRYKKNPTVHDFHCNVVDMVYGDDKLNGIVNADPNLNAITMEEFFTSIGMKMTTANKQVITKPYESLSEVSFLKRTFEYHPLIGRVMCPLDKKTLRNTIMWVDSKKDVDVVITGKLRSFIMEMYLHEDGQDEVEYVRTKCEEIGIDWPNVTDDYLLNLFTNDLVAFDNMYGDY